ncbi:MAG: ion transporter [Pseudomonadota bacterium]
MSSAKYLRLGVAPVDETGPILRLNQEVFLCFNSRDHATRHPDEARHAASTLNRDTRIPLGKEFASLFWFKGSRSLTMQARLHAIISSRSFQGLVLGLIIINAVILGAETIDGVKDSVGQELMILDRIIIYTFAVEILMRFFAEPRAYFRNGWNIFDFVIVLVSFLAATSGLAAIRAFRVLRVLRVVTVIPRMRVVVSALLDAIPGIASVGVVLILIVYVFAVIAANLYGGDHEIFGDVFVSMYTLFQVMTLEGWPDIAAEVAMTHPNSWIFFLTFVLIATFTMLNLFVAIVVRVVEEDSDALLTAETKLIQSEIRQLRADIKAMVDSRDRDS